MSPRLTKKTIAAAAAAEEKAARTLDALMAMGLKPGAAVRFRRRDTTHWLNGKVVGVEKDGSMSIVDAKGAARAIPVDLVEVKSAGPRGGTVWQPLPELIASTEQLRLL